MSSLDVPAGEEQLVHVPTGEVTLEGNLVIPKDATGVVLFAPDKIHTPKKGSSK